MKQWLVYKDGENIGLMTAKEIRHALRMGSIDPFDLVSAEGSSIKSELVEVDEIFKEEEAQATEEDPGSTQVREPEPAPPETKTVAYNPHRQVPDRKKIKQFYLIDGSRRTLGPVSAEEVLSLYQRGIVDDAVKIQKSENSKKIPVRQFVSSYSGKRVKALAEKANPAAANPSSKVLNELHQAMRSRKLVNQKGVILKVSKVVAVLLAVIVLVITVSSFWGSSKRRGDISPPKPKKVDLRVKKRAPTKQVAKRKIKRKRTPKKVSARARVKKRSVAKSNRPIKAKDTKRRIVSRAQKRKSITSRERGAERLIISARKRAGGILTIGPLIYKPNDLRKCGVKCRLKFYDSQGSVLEGVFFKGAFQEKLQRRQKSVTISGSSKIEGGTLVIFVQGVK